jgi:signal transduction histidine kinase
MPSSFFVFRKTLAWVLAGVILSAVVSSVSRRGSDWFYAIALVVVPAFMMVRTLSHVRRVRLVADHVDSAALANRHRRQIEIPLPAGEAFSLVEAAVRDLPLVDNVEVAHDSLQVRARVKRRDRGKRNQVLGIVRPGEGTSTLKLVCEPEGGHWNEWFVVDDATNLENVEALTRAITRRINEARKGEAAKVRESAVDKELAVAKLSLLHAQVEPHFLYNTLASAQLLTRSDPARADQMLGHLITYLRNSLPSTEESISTLGAELERAQAYLEILRIRMGERLGLQIQVPESLKHVPLPPMMLQTLVENAIKHGLEPITGGGTIWIIARESGGTVSVTVADDGRGFAEGTGGTGIGLKNIRERLRLAYGDAATFIIVANFPRGVAATINVPAVGPKAVIHA